MAKKLYVGNLPYKCADEDLRELFSEFGTVVDANVVMDRMTGRSRGFGFIQMDTDEQAQAAIDGLHEKEFMGRMLTVNESRPREPREGGGGGRRGGGREGGGYSRHERTDRPY